MIVYEVCVAVAPARAAEYRAWLAEHVGELLALPGFVDACVYALEPDSDPWPRWCVHYRLIDRAALQDYFEQHAARLRAAGMQRFGNDMRAERRILLPQPLQPE